MSAEVTSRTGSSLIIARLTAAAATRSAAVWGAVFGSYVAVSALGYASTYPTQAERTRLAITFSSNVGFNALIGPARQIGTVAGFTAWRSLGVLSIVGGVWGLLAGTRLLRGEEDSGRWEVLLAGHTTRRTATAKALLGSAAGPLTLWLLSALGAVAVGRAGSVRIGVGPALFLALALTCSAAIFLAVGALASQLAATRRQAAGYCAVGLGMSYALRMIADSGTGLEWLRWLSPLGWVEELRPLADPHPLVLAPIVALIAALSASAIYLAGTRDLAASVIADRPRARARTRLLAGPTGLTIRLGRAVLAGWAVSIALGALMMGLIAKSVGSAMTDASTNNQAFARMGLRGSGAQQYLGVTFLVLGLLVALVAAGQLSAVRTEEADGRLEHLLVRPVSRQRWLISRLTVAGTAVLAAGLIAGLASWLGAASQHSGIDLASLLGAGVNVVPPALFLLGAGCLTFGVAPRLTPAVAYGLLAWSFLVEIIGEIVNASHWLLDTSLFHQVTAAPAVAPNWTSGLVLSGLGLLAGALGVVAFGRRDLAGH